MLVREGESKENLASARRVETILCSVVGTNYLHGLDVYTGCGMSWTVQKISGMCRVILH